MTFLPPFPLRWGQQNHAVNERQGLSSPAIPLHPGMRNACLHHRYPKAAGRDADEGPVLIQKGLQSLALAWVIQNGV